MQACLPDVGVLRSAQHPLHASIRAASSHDDRHTLTCSGLTDLSEQAYNMAALWKVPVIFIIENNHFGMGTAVKRASKSASFFTRGDYIPGLWIDGMDVLAVKNGVAFAREFVLQNGPIVLEMVSPQAWPSSVPSSMSAQIMLQRMAWPSAELPAPGLRTQVLCPVNSGLTRLADCVCRRHLMRGSARQPVHVAFAISCAARWLDGIHDGISGCISRARP